MPDADDVVYLNKVSVLVFLRNTSPFSVVARCCRAHNVFLFAWYLLGSQLYPVEVYNCVLNQ